MAALLAYIIDADNRKGGIIQVSPSDALLLKRKDMAANVKAPHVHFAFTQPCLSKQELMDRVSATCFEDPTTLTRLKDPQPPISFNDLEKQYRPNSKKWKSSFRLLAPFAGFRAGVTLQEVVSDEQPIKVTPREKIRGREKPTKTPDQVTVEATQRKTAIAKPQPTTGTKRKATATANSTTPSAPLAPYKSDSQMDHFRLAVLKTLIASPEGIPSNELKSHIPSEQADYLTKLKGSPLYANSTKGRPETGLWTKVDNRMLVATEYGRKWYQEAMEAGADLHRHSAASKRVKHDHHHHHGEPAVTTRKRQPLLLQSPPQQQQQQQDKQPAADARNIEAAQAQAHDAGQNGYHDVEMATQDGHETDGGAAGDDTTGHARDQEISPHLKLAKPVRFGMNVPGWLPPNEWLVHHYNITVEDGKVGVHFRLVVNDVVGPVENILMWVEQEGAPVTIQFPDALPSLMGSVTGWHAWHSYDNEEDKPAWKEHLAVSSDDGRPILVMEVIQGWQDKIREALEQADREKEELIHAHSQQMQQLQEAQDARQEAGANAQSLESLQAQLDAAVLEKEELQKQIDSLKEQLAAKDEELDEMRPVYNTFCDMAGRMGSTSAKKREVAAENGTQ